MGKHIVQKGEGLSKLAEQYGFSPETIWKHPHNKHLKELRKDSNILMPGDELWIPDKMPKSVAVVTGQRNRFKRKGVPAVFRLRLLKNDKPRIGVFYRLEIDDQQIITGTIDNDQGLLEAKISPKAQYGRLFVENDPPLMIHFGELNPASEEEIVGVQQRLHNLGLYDGDCHGKNDISTQAAVASFQSQYGLSPTGEIDRETIAQLIGVHDGSRKS